MSIIKRSTLAKIWGGCRPSAPFSPRFLQARTWKIDRASDNVTHLIVYCLWNIISLNMFPWMTALDWMTLNNTRSRHFTKGRCYIIQLVSTRLTKNRSSCNALVSRKTIFAYDVPHELPIHLKSSGALNAEDIAIISKLDWGTQSPFKK